MLLEKSKKFKIILVVAGIFAVVAAVFLIGLAKSVNKEVPSQNAATLLPQTNSEGGVSITVDSENFNFNNPQFRISFETHQGDLDFDLKETAVLIADNQREYQSLAWDGGRGGHHLSGILYFPAISAETKNIKLIIKNVYGVAAREFFWVIQ